MLIVIAGLALAVLPQVPDSRPVVRGVVREARTNVPVPLAAIRLVRSAVSTRTDREGAFQLGVAVLPDTLLVTAPGFRQEFGH